MSEWLNLGETAVLLGVHPATVRTWGDRGDLAMRRTPGGHRRFRRADVEARLVQQDRGQMTGAQLIVQNMMGRARLELSDGALQDESWYQILDQPAKRSLREIGRRLLQLVIRFLKDEAARDELMKEAAQVGIAYQQLGEASGLTLVDTTRAFLFFQEFLSQSIYDIAFTTGTHGPTDWGHLRREIVFLTNEILIALIDAATMQSRSLS